MGKISELKGVEKPVTEWLTKMGWTFKSNEDLKVHNRTFSNLVLVSILIDKTVQINNIDRRAVKTNSSKFSDFEEFTFYKGKFKSNKLYLSLIYEETS